MDKKEYYKGPERRKHMRLHTVCEIEYVRLTKSLKPKKEGIEKASTKDVSSGGLSFMSTKKFSKGDILEFQIKIHGIDNSITGIGEIKRIQPKPGSKSSEIALKFIWMHQKYRELIDTTLRARKMQRLLKKLNEN